MTDDRGWAIVTGASSGIGRALALEFANGGFNVFLTGRDEKALAEAAAECSRTSGIATQVVPSDLSRPEGVARVIAALEHPPRRWEALVNNAGFGIHGDFASSDIELEAQLVQLQLTATLRLVKAVLPGMIAQRSGRILNVASVYSFSPVPFQSVYSAAKAFLQSFSASLRDELQGTGVTVTLLCPGITQTRFRSRAGIREKHSNSGMTAAETARMAYEGTMRAEYLVVPGTINRVFVLACRVLPTAVVARLIKRINRVRGQQS